MSTNLGFTHRLVFSGAVPPPITLLLVHGTGSNEEELLPLGHTLLRGAGILSPRGKVLENGMPRVFRRLAKGVFDVADLKFRANELAQFIEAARREYAISGEFIGVGYSNGANIAAALILLHPNRASWGSLISGNGAFRS
jgi:phospholipase/carboxylesterase